MADRTQFFPGQQLVLITLTERIEGADLIRIIDEMFESPEWEEGYNILWDGRRIRELIVTPDDVKAIKVLSEHRRNARGSGRAAIVALRDIDLMIAELLQQVIHFDSTIRIFSDIRDAARYVGIEDDLSVLSED